MNILLIIPPFTQVNTCYPSVTQLSGYLNSKGYDCKSCDLSLNVFLNLFSKEGLNKIFSYAERTGVDDFYSERILSLKNNYINTVEPIINFLQGNDLNLAHRIALEKYIPQGESFEHISDEIEAFGYFGIQDKAKYYSSLFISDLTKFIQKNITPHFGLSKYAEQISASKPTFDSIEAELQRETNLVEQVIINECNKVVELYKPNLIGFSIPFPGNLLGALISAKFIKEEFNDIKIVLGGGYVNTELRKLSDPKIFKYTDFITLDDGETPIINIIDSIEDPTKDKFVRTFLLNKNEVEFRNNGFPQNVLHNELSPPSLKGINPNKYVAITEMLNPMHRLWTDGYWNKLMVAHGCYWKKCTFCDINLDYIGRYSPAKAATIVNWMEDLIKQTGKTSFHFTDEAAPPSVLKEVALEIIKRNLSLTWWGNIRFEKSFTSDLCRLLAASGCIAVSGGLEVADERLLKLIQKGVTLEQVALVCNNFKTSGIMVHAYLMYGFPTQTEQEIINSLELVRQFMELNLFQSAYWHLFALTIHSPIAQYPEMYGVKILSNKNNPFGNNDLVHKDLTNIDHSKYSSGLKKAIYNFMHGIGFENDVRNWFGFPTPKTTIKHDLISNFIINNKISLKENTKSIWLGSVPTMKELNSEYCELQVSLNDADAVWELKTEIGYWILQNLLKSQNEDLTQKDWKNTFPKNGEFEQFINSDTWIELRESGLLFV